MSDPSPLPPPSDPLQTSPGGEALLRTSSFDFGSLLAALAAKWRRIAGTALVFALLGLAAALAILRPSYTANVQLGRHEPPPAADAYTPPPLSTATLHGMITSAEVLQRTGAALAPPLTAAQLVRRLALTEDRNTGLLTVAASGSSPLDAVTLANRFSLETVRFTQALQQADADDAGLVVTRKLADNATDRVALDARLAAIESARLAARRAEQGAQLAAQAPTAATVDRLKFTRLEERAQVARDQLGDLLARYTEAHPLVREQKSRVTALETQLREALPAASASAERAPALAVAPADQSAGYDALVLSLGRLENERRELVARSRAIALFSTHAPGYLRLMQTATVGTVTAQRNRLSIAALTLLCGALGALGAFVSVTWRELRDDRLRTGADVERVTLLPLLGSLGHLGRMSGEKQKLWAFRTWTALQGKLSHSPNQGLVCGFTSSGPGEGRSTWIALLAQCARQCGFTVLTITSAQIAGRTPASSAPPDSASVEPPSNGTAKFETLVTSDPTQLIALLGAPQLNPAASLPLPSGWIWNLERRKQWQLALNSWREIDNVVIFIELPPVSDPETVLLAENMPNLIWLAESRKAGAAETLDQLETLRHARCRLVGAVLNRAPDATVHRPFARWFGPRSSLVASVLGLMGSPVSTRAAEAEEAVPPAPAFGVVEPAQRAAWQQKLTLGPGDVLNFSVFGQPELTQGQVPVGPDGRISFLEAQNVVADGLTVDELRLALNRELGKFRSAPEVIVVPVSYQSKKFYVLGAVTRKGAFPLQRPLTIVEAVAQADGLEMGTTDRSTTIVADLSRSFIARQGRHLPVDFEKLFLSGDLTQNIAIEPNDYLYFPSGERSQIYVLGEVRFPGPLAYRASTGTLAAIAVRGGFSERAWRTRLLVVRGSLGHPQAFVINAADVLAARRADFTLQPRDIVFVSSRPWIRAEELLDEAASAFVQAAVITATGLHVDRIDTR